MCGYKRNNLYLQQATREEKEVFISTLCTLAQIDGKIKAEEMRFIEILSQKLELELEPQFFSYSTTNCLHKLSNIKNRRLKLEIIKTMLIMAYTNNNFSDSESSFICAVSEALQIEAQKISEISSWIIDHIIWLEQEQLIFEETSPKGE